jgi:electron transfer flavoprotein beta subunit
VPSCGASAATAVQQFEMPPAKSGCKMIPADQAASLIQLLHEEAKVI